MTTFRRWPDVLLRLYPAEFRDRFGDEMRATLAAALADRPSRWSRARFVAVAVGDALVTAAAEWRDTISPFRPSLAMIPFRQLPSVFHQAARSLRRSPSFAITAALTLAIGVGASTAVFSVMSAALLTPLPYPAASRLVTIMDARRGEEISMSFLNLRDYASRARVVEAIGGVTGRNFTLTGRVATGGADPVRVPGAMITANLFSVLGVAPMLGHDFTSRDDDPGAAPVVAIARALWLERFGGDSTIIGRAITLDGVPFTVVAVMPDGFRFPDGIVYGPASIWTPMSQLGAIDREQRDSHPGIVGIGRLRAHATFAQGRAELRTIGSQLVAEYPDANRDGGVFVNDAIDAVVGSLRDSIRVLLGAALLVLLIGCANVAGLFLTRADARRREMAIRAALGAAGARASATFVAEAVLIAVAGGAAGALLAQGLVRVFGSALANLPRLGAVAVDGRALMFTAVTTLAVALFCAALPAWWSRRVDVQRWLQARGSGDATATRFRHALVVGQIAISLMLVVSSALLLRTFQRANADPGGIHANDVTTFAVQLPDARYPSDAARAAFVSAMTQQLNTMTGVAQAGAVSLLPFTGAGSQSGIGPAGGTREQEHRTDVAAVTPRYFAAIGMELIAGRGFTDADIGPAPGVAVVDERFAATMWPGESAIGKRVSGWTRPEWTVVGVVRHVKNYGVTEESRQEMFVPFAQRPTARVYFAVRSTSPSATIIAAARAQVNAVDATLPVFAARSMRSVVDATIASPRLAAFLSLGYALTALIVAMVGIHGAIAYLVSRRTREIGVRMALGAQSQQVLRLVLGRTLALTALGVAIGLVGALGSTRFLSRMLYGVAPTDALTYGFAASAMLGVGLLAAAMPAWRAARVSPLVALAEE